MAESRNCKSSKISSAMLLSIDASLAWGDVTLSTEKVGSDSLRLESKKK